MSCLIDMYFYFLASDWLTTTAETYSGKAIAKEQIIVSHVRFLFCSIFHPRTNIYIAHSSTSVTCIKIS